MVVVWRVAEKFTPQWSDEGGKSIREDNKTFRDAIHRFCVLTGCPPDRNVDGQMDWLDEMAARFLYDAKLIEALAAVNEAMDIGMARDIAASAIVKYFHEDRNL